MNSAFAKVSNLKVNRASKIAITLASSTFFLYALGQAPILKIFLQVPSLALAKQNIVFLEKLKT